MIAGPIFYIDCGTHKEIIRDDKSLFKCPWCGDWFRALAYHTRQKHGITSQALKRAMGLKANYQLITHDLKLRHREIALNNIDVCIIENLIMKGEATRYNKGCSGHIKANWSPQARNKKVKA
jgi:hypothetical protein